jgi:uncharacterized membrane protein (Fun14 family)
MGDMISFIQRWAIVLAVMIVALTIGSIIILSGIYISDHFGVVGVVAFILLLLSALVASCVEED